jgi:phosphatidylinositol alpha-1,6-mannosyltransferase
MERLTFHTYEALREMGQCSLIGPAGCGQFTEPDTLVAECHLKPLLRFLAETWAKSRKMARTQRPRFIMAASGLTAPAAVSAARRSGSVAITVVHGLDIITPYPIYQKFFIPAIRQSDVVIANSANTAQLARSAGVAGEKIEVLHPGVTLPPSPVIPAKAGIQFLNTYASRDWRHQMELGDLKNRKILLSVGRLVPRKGLSEFIDQAMPQLVEREPRIMLLIAGGEATNALKRDAGVLVRIRDAIEKHHLEDHVRVLGRITDDAVLATLYAHSDVFVMPLIEQKDDVEGFGMVAVEAAAHGLPTAGFRLGGLPDAVADQHSGLLVPAGDYPALVAAILDLLGETRHTGITAAICRAHAEQFEWPRYAMRLREICGHTLPRHAAQ